MTRGVTVKLGITQKDYEILKEQLAAKQTKMDSLGLDLGDAMSRTGSFPASSPEYAAVHLEIKNLQNNVDYLKDVLAKYTIIDENKDNRDKVGTYTIVVMRDIANGEQICYQIGLAELNTKEQNDCFLATTESPVGQALLGHKLGDKIEIKLPAGTRKYEITGLSKEY
jgi:transcription elongation factor GreA